LRSAERRGKLSITTLVWVRRGHQPQEV
jgi:hypothetical protein